MLPGKDPGERILDPVLRSGLIYMVVLTTRVVTPTARVRVGLEVFETV